MIKVFYPTIRKMNTYTLSYYGSKYRSDLHTLGLAMILENLEEWSID